MSTTETPETRLAALGLTLPAAAAAAANYVPFTLSGQILYIAGQIPFLNGQKGHIGRLGEDFSITQGQDAARACALNILAQAKAAAGGDWSRIRRCLRLGVFVNSTPAFDQQPAVANGASDLMVAAFGESGRHTRAAIGVTSLPFGVAVEIDAVFEIGE